ncbi:MAG: hypothetical protein HC859_09960 [Bacteroidia bacterium]|nr:hypothetical protein [Bacteroidia bacterium]
MPEEELPTRYGDYAKLLALRVWAYGVKGRISIIGGDAETADVAHQAMDSWLRGKTRYLGETNTVEEYGHFIFVKTWTENRGNLNQSDLQLGRLLNDLKKKTNPNNALAHELYLAYLEELFREENRARYLNTKLEYQKVLDKYFPKTSLHRINMQAVEFNARISREKTKDLENVAHNILTAKSSTQEL